MRYAQLGGCNYIPHKRDRINNCSVLTTESTLLVCCTVRGRNPLRYISGEILLGFELRNRRQTLHARADIAFYDSSARSVFTIVIDSLKVACTIGLAATVTVNWCRK